MCSACLLDLEFIPAQDSQYWILNAPRSEFWILALECSPLRLQYIGYWMLPRSYSRLKAPDTPTPHHHPAIPPPQSADGRPFSSAWTLGPRTGESLLSNMLGFLLSFITMNARVWDFTKFKGSLKGRAAVYKKGCIWRNLEIHRKCRNDRLFLENQLLIICLAQHVIPWIGLSS